MSLRPGLEASTPVLSGRRRAVLPREARRQTMLSPYGLKQIITRKRDPRVPARCLNTPGVYDVRCAAFTKLVHTCSRQFRKSVHYGLVDARAITYIEGA